MPAKDRELLLKINEQIKKLNTPPPTTFAPQTGDVSEIRPATSGATLRPLPPTIQR